MLCPLCNTESASFYKKPDKHFYQCPLCKGIFADRKYLLDPQSEFERYKKHQNDICDIKYREFSSPIVKAVLSDFLPGTTGLDFGSGSSSAVSAMLKEVNYDIKQYDPYFHNYPELLECQYDYIALCEVAEHFHNPAKEFALLNSLLKNNGKLYCMTNIYSPEKDFGNWYYKNDFTHVFFYQNETFEYIKSEFEFSMLEIKTNLVVLSK